MFGLGRPCFAITLHRRLQHGDEVGTKHQRTTPHMGLCSIDNGSEMQVEVMFAISRQYLDREASVWSRCRLCRVYPTTRTPSNSGEHWLSCSLRALVSTIPASTMPQEPIQRVPGRCAVTHYQAPIPSPVSSKTPVNTSEHGALGDRHQSMRPFRGWTETLEAVFARDGPCFAAGLRRVAPATTSTANTSQQRTWSSKQSKLLEDTNSSLGRDS